MQSESTKFGKAAWALIIIASLGYFVDVYDLLLFSVVRSASLTGIGVAANQLLPVGLALVNWQAAGLLIGGIVWGIMGDRRGRMSVLFGSIALYSIANILNSFVTNVPAYEVFRFLAGLGLAGELGAGITLVSESVPTGKRGIATMIIAGVGFLGAVAASLVGTNFTWQTAFMVGGIGGLVLLLLRASAFESGLYNKMKTNIQVQRGNFFMLFNNWKRFWKYLISILSGAPVYFLVSIILTATPEFGKAEGLSPLPTAAMSVLIGYLALVVGDIVCSSLSQVLKSRKIPLIVFNVLFLITASFFVLYKSPNLEFFYFKVALAGFAVGFWAMLNTNAAEQFGTNLRSTVATTVPNFVRGLAILITFMFTYFTTTWGLSTGSLGVIVILSAIAITASSLLKETFSKELDYIEL